MPDSVEHRVEMHRVAQQRKAAGQPIWDRKINLADVFHNEAMTFEQRRDAIVRTLRASRWVKEHSEQDAFGGLVEVVDNLAAAEDIGEFDGWLDELYDHADNDRVWINTH
ncbi:hypothetical protein [Spirillospora sp. NBC_01491]|uniref:hypothetical protein n=1 Tax=Spirillospora sp. NBC_01491 TaxID=2976007 RepID=UPI002E355609|nr:hypothetical protein [Spirillospora sp. NBC_01491]